MINWKTLQLLGSEFSVVKVVEIYPHLSHACIKLLKICFGHSTVRVFIFHFATTLKLLSKSICSSISIEILHVTTRLNKSWWENDLDQLFLIFTCLHKLTEVLSNSGSNSSCWKLKLTNNLSASVGFSSSSTQTHTHTNTHMHAYTDTHEARRKNTQKEHAERTRNTHSKHTQKTHIKHRSNRQKTETAQRNHTGHRQSTRRKPEKHTQKTYRNQSRKTQNTHTHKKQRTQRKTHTEYTEETRRQYRENTQIIQKKTRLGHAF